jgi:predicted metal-dependent hydrolase
MKVPEVLRDYVILHELAHLNHMDHSKEFWAEVATHDKNYKIHEKKLKHFSPGL